MAKSVLGDTLAPFIGGFLDAIHRGRYLIVVAFIL
jgi:hypothetical protein